MTITTYYLITRISLAICVDLGNMLVYILEPAVALRTLLPLVHMCSIVMFQHQRLGQKHSVTILCPTRNGFILVASLVCISYVVLDILNLFSTDVAHFLLLLPLMRILDVVLEPELRLITFVAKLTSNFLTQVYHPDMIVQIHQTTGL